MMRQNSSLEKRVAFLTSFGSFLEYYDFVVYGMMTPYLSMIFFPDVNPFLAILQSFGIFAVGYLARPLGGMFLGIMGDRLGRKPAFLFSTTLMAVSTLSMGLLPSYETLGILSVVVLIFCRILQGCSFGAELPGAMTMVGEFTTKSHQGHKTSLIVASASLGALMASAVLFLLTTFLNKEQVIIWGWRLPFLMGGILGIGLFMARRSLPETPIFHARIQKKQNNHPLSVLLKFHLMMVLRGVALTAFVSSLIIVNLYFPYYIPKFFKYDTKDVYFAITIALLFGTFALPFMGKGSDFFTNKIKALRGVCFIYICLTAPLFFLLSIGTLWSLIIFLIIHQVFIGIFSTCYFPILIQLFPPEVRYTGTALSYNLTYAIMALLPMALTAVLTFCSTLWVVPLALSGMALLSFLGTWKLSHVI